MLINLATQCKIDEPSPASRWETDIDLSVQCFVKASHPIKTILVNIRSLG